MNVRRPLSRSLLSDHDKESSPTCDAVLSATVALRADLAFSSLDRTVSVPSASAAEHRVRLLGVAVHHAIGRG